MSRADIIDRYFKKKEGVREMSASDNDEVICPNCVHQFRAIPVNVQAELATAIAQRDRLAAAFKKLGKHGLLCPVTGGFNLPCKCGFDQAIKECGK